jgi:hypothetical protein
MIRNLLIKGKTGENNKLGMFKDFGHTLSFLDLGHNIITDEMSGVNLWKNIMNPLGSQRIKF